MQRCRLIIAVLCVLIGLTVIGTAMATVQKEAATATQLRIGTFDSRAVAFAYARSDMFEKWLENLQAKNAQAEKEKDDARIKELGEQAQAEHALRSKQVFSTFPVYDVLERIEEEIPKIAAQAGVDMIISKWDIVYKRPELEFIDVTELMIQLFNLDEDALTNLEQLLQQEPVPLGEMGEDEGKQ